MPWRPELENMESGLERENENKESSLYDKEEKNEKEQYEFDLETVEGIKEAIAETEASLKLILELKELGEDLGKAEEIMRGKLESFRARLAEKLSINPQQIGKATIGVETYEKDAANEHVLGNIKEQTEKQSLEQI